MVLPALQVVVRDQNYKLPNDSKLYVIVGMIDSAVVSAASPYLLEEPIGSDEFFMKEIQECQMAEYIQIDLLSRSNQAILRKSDIILSLNSIYSKQKQEEFNFKIARLPRSFVNTSYAEGGSQLNRFSISFSCLTWYRKEKVLSANGGNYYDEFSTRVDDEETIGTDKGIIEFEIPAA